MTVVLIHGNGSPRTFRLSLPALQRSLTAIGFFFALSVAAALFLLVLNLFYTTSGSGSISPPPAPVASNPPPPAATELVQPSPPPANSEGFWTRLSPKPGSPDSQGSEELRKELDGLREDISKLNAQANGRKDLSQGVNSGLLQFFGPRNVPETDSPIQVKNVKVVQDPSGKEVFVDFELHNVDPQQRQSRGYIVVLAKTKNLLLSYPENTFTPTQNIVLDFTKGETFGVSRFRQARANFPAAPLAGKQPRFQVLLFSTNGKVIADLHVEDKR